MSNVFTAMELETPFQLELQQMSMVLGQFMSQTLSFLSNEPW